MKVFNEGVFYMPLKVALWFLVITELLVWVGPIDYDIRNSWLLASYLLIINLFFYLGYKRGVKKFRPSQCDLHLHWINIFIVIGSILTYDYLIRTWAARGFMLSVENIIYAIVNSGDLYFADVKEGTGSSSRIMQILSVVRWSAIPLGMYYWKRLSKPIKIVVILTILCNVLVSLGRGTRQGLFDTIIVSFFCYYAGAYVYLNASCEFEKIKKKLKYLMLIVAGVFLFFFVLSNLSRSGLGISEIGSASFRNHIRSFYKFLPTGAVYAISSPTSYLCQGYYALSLALEIGVLPPIPLSTNWFTVIWSQEHLNTNPLAFSYMEYLEAYGIGSMKNWHTIYLWLANQYTFYFVPVVIYIIGFFFARLWCDILNGHNSFAVPMFSLILIMVFYFYANNQVLSFLFLPFIGWLFLYFISLLLPHK